MGFRLIFVLLVYHEWRGIRRWAYSVFGFGFSQLGFGPQFGSARMGSLGFIRLGAAQPRVAQSSVWGRSIFSRGIRKGAGSVLVSIPPGSAGVGQDQPGTVQFDSAQRHHGSHLNARANSPTLLRHQKILIGSPQILKLSKF